MSESELKRLAARADLCRLLAACYYEPGPEFAEERLFDSMRVAASELGAAYVAPVDAMAAAFAAQPLEALRVDYTRLFLNPGGALAPPYESVWVAGKDPMGAEHVTRSVLDSYRHGGYDVDNSFRDLPDHVAAELEFLYTVLFSEAGARNARDDRGCVAAAALRHAFIERHLGRWIHPFAQAMRAGAESPLYRELAVLTEAFIADERSQP